MGLQIEAIDELAADYVDAGREQCIEQEQMGERSAQQAIAERSLAAGQRD